MKLKENLKVALLPVVVAAALTACGGGGGVVSGAIPLSAAGTPSFVSAGPVNGGRVYIDMDDSRTQTASDVMCGTTASDGSYTCYYPNGLTEATNTHLLISVGGVDTFTGLTINRPLLSVPGATHISPLTTLATLQAISGIPAGTTLNLTTLKTSFTQVNTTMVQSLGLPSGTRLDTDNALASGKERLLAAETAVQSLLEETIGAIASATGLPANALGNSYDAAFTALANEIANLRGAALNLSRVGAGSTVDNVINAAATVPALAANLNASGVQNVVNLANQPIASSVGGTLSLATGSAVPSALTIQGAASNSTTNITTINQTINVVKNTIQNSVYTGPQIGGIRNVYNTIFKGGYTVNNMTAINTAITQLTTNYNIIQVVQAAPTAFPDTWVFNGMKVAGNGSAPITASGVGAINSTLGGSYNIPAAASGVAAGLQTATMTLIPNATLNNAMTGGTASTTYRASIGLSVTPVSLTPAMPVVSGVPATPDTRRIQVVIQNVPISVDSTGMHITNLAGATLSAYGNNSKNSSFNIVLANLPTNLLTTATNAAANTAALPNNTDVTLDIQALFTALAGVGGNAGFANLNLLKGTFDVSMAISLQDLSALGAPAVYIADPNSTTLSNSASQYLSTNVVSVTNVLAQVLGQGKVLTVTLN
jgi:energy-converting hydrogenase Eha subunit A